MRGWPLRAALDRIDTGNPDDPRLHLTVTDRDLESSFLFLGGARQRIDNVSAGSAIRIVEGRDEPERVAERRFALVDPLSADEVFQASLGVRQGASFPDLALSSQSGETLTLRDLSRPGRRLLVNVWATWCVPCAAEIPELQKLHARRDLPDLHHRRRGPGDAVSPRRGRRTNDHPARRPDPSLLARVHPASSSACAEDRDR